MKIVRFRRSGERKSRYGLLEPPEAKRIGKGLGNWTVREILDRTLDAPKRFGPPESMAKLELLVPAEPTKIVGIGKNYLDHAAEMGTPPPAEPLVFLKACSAIIRSGQPIVVPADVGPVHYEGEIAVVIGKRVRNWPAARWREAVLGVTAGNDVTARALQKSDGQWARAKSFDSFCPLGPAIETEFDLDTLTVSTLLDGKRVQNGVASDMAFRIPKLIEYISRAMTLEPGDVILTGTPAGVGPIAPGRIVEVLVGDLPPLINPVVAELGS